MSGARDRRGRMLLAGTAAVAVLLPGPAAAAAPVWTFVPMAVPDGPPGSSYSLLDVVAVTEDEAWAVGHSSEPDGDLYRARPLIEHWDGVRWSVVAGPGPALPGGPRAVDAVSRQDVWAVGDTYDAALGYRSDPFIEHYDGVRWSAVPDPPPGGAGGAQLNAVDMLSAGDGWAVGAKHVSPGTTSDAGVFAVRWNGSRWTEVTAPNPGRRYNELRAVSGTSANNVWAVGNYSDQDVVEVSKTLALHWNGTRWRRVPSPSPDTVNVLAAVHARSPDDVWAVGYGHPDAAHGGYDARWPIALHWDGRAWQRMTTPPGVGLQFTDVLALSATDVWLVGYAGGPSATDERTLLMHWDGTRFTVHPGPALIRPMSEVGTALNALSASGPTVWALGVRWDGGDGGDGDTTFNPLMLRHTRS